MSQNGECATPHKAPWMPYSPIAAAHPLFRFARRIDRYNVLEMALATNDRVAPLHRLYHTADMRASSYSKRQRNTWTGWFIVSSFLLVQVRSSIVSILEPWPVLSLVAHNTLTVPLLIPFAPALLVDNAWPFIATDYSVVLSYIVTIIVILVSIPWQLLVARVLYWHWNRHITRRYSGVSSARRRILRSIRREPANHQ